MCTELANQIWGMNQEHICEKTHVFILTQSQKYLELWNHWDFLSLQKSFILLTNIMEGIKKDVILWEN